MLPQWFVGDAGYGLHLEAIGKREFVQLARDRLRLERSDVARDRQIDIGSRRVRALRPGSEENR